jgi:putative transposase
MFAFVARHRGIWPVSWMCDALDVSRSGFFAWLRRGPSARAQADETIGAHVRTSFLQSDRTYGARRVWKDVLEAGLACGLHRIEKLMRAQAFRARPKRRRLPPDTGLRSTASIAPNMLDRQFEAQAPNQKWAADFTYIWTAEGWLYVAAVLDLYSRRIVGWSMSATMTAELATDALMMAIWRRGKADALLHHSDRGSQPGLKPSSQHLHLSRLSASAKASAGDRHPSVLRGRSFNAAATASSSSSLCAQRSVPFGKY